METAYANILSYTSVIDNKNCTIQISYPILDTLHPRISQKSKYRLNKLLKNRFFEARHFNTEIGCNSKNRKIDKAYYMEVKYEVTLNLESYVSLIYSATGFPAGAKEPHITKRGITLHLLEGYPLFFGELFRKDSGYKKILEETLIEQLLEKGILQYKEEFTIYRKKSYEFALREKDLVLLLEDKQKNTLEVLIPYGKIHKILNKEIFIDE